MSFLTLIAAKLILIGPSSLPPYFPPSLRPFRSRSHPWLSGHRLSQAIPRPLSPPQIHPSLSPSLSPSLPPSGPSALGHIPGYLDTVFPKQSLGYLALVANLGLVLYLFLVGVELDPEVLRRNGKKAVSIAVVGIALPFGLGCLISPLHFNKLPIKDPG